MSIFRCKLCNERVKVANSICAKCRLYMATKEQLIHKPDSTPGKQDFDYRGRPICKICGKAFDNLGNHLYPSHKITIKEYKVMFDIPISMQLSSKPRLNQLKSRPATSTTFKKGCNHKGVGKGTKKTLTQAQRDAQAERMRAVVRARWSK